MARWPLLMRGPASSSGCSCPPVVLCFGMNIGFKKVSVGKKKKKKKKKKVSVEETLLGKVGTPFYGEKYMMTTRKR